MYIGVFYSTPQMNTLRHKGPVTTEQNPRVEVTERSESRTQLLFPRMHSRACHPTRCSELPSHPELLLLLFARMLVISPLSSLLMTSFWDNIFCPLSLPLPQHKHIHTHTHACEQSNYSYSFFSDSA